jgi:hypothetical protein
MGQNGVCSILLPHLSYSFDPYQHLLWSDLIFRKDNSVLICVKIPKTANQRCEFVDLFSFPNLKYCPVSFLKQLRANQQTLGCFSLHQPVFRFSTNKNLSVSQFSNTIQSLLKPLNILGPQDSITAHSFRPGIPSTLTTLPHPPSEFEIKLWGRWTSEAYEHYLRLKTDQRKSIFDRLASHFLPLC